MPDPRIRRQAVFIQVAVLAGLMTLLFWHEIARLFHAWQTQSNWSHGFIVPLFSLYFLYAHREELASVPVRESLWGLPVLLGGLLLYFVSIWPLQMGYPKSVAIVVCLFGVVLYRCGWRIMRITWLPILYLMFAVPLPDRVYVRMTMPLRRLASAVGGMLLSVIPGVEVTVSGVTMELMKDGEVLATLNVVDACSGMRVLIGLCALGVAIAYLGDRPTWQRITLVIFCVPIGVFTNLLRVTSTGLFHVFGWDYLTEHAGHTAWGLAMYTVALGVFFLLSHILSHLVVEDREGDEVGPEGLAPDDRA